MDTFLDILKYILPSLVVLITAFVVMRGFLENEQKKMQSQGREEWDKVVIPLRLQAYERMILFLERISPASLILRASQPEMDASQLQTVIIRTIREEFEHNLSQQLFISDAAWELIKNAKEELVRHINMAAAQVDVNASSHELASAIFDALLKAKELPVEKALAFLKKEFRELSK